MNLQTLVVVLLRLVSLNFLLGAAAQFAPLVLRAYQQSQPGQLNGSLEMLWFLATGLGAGAVLLWLFAPSIATLITRGQPLELSFGTLSLADCYSIAFIGVGLFYWVGHAAPALNWMHYLLRMAASHSVDNWKEQVQWYNVTQPFFSFVLGIILFVNGRRWGVALARRHSEQTPPTTPPVEMGNP